MGVTFGFYNSVGSDRKYDSIQMSKLFDGLITDGVFASIGTRLNPVPSDPPSMNIVVGEGRAWFDHTWTLNDSELVLAVDAPHVTLNRIDAVVLEVDASEAVRANSIKIVKGTPASTPVPPEMVHTTFVNQYALGYISVPVGISAITNAHISIVVGTTPCPYVTGVVQSFDMSSLVAQWQEEFSDWRDAEEAAFIDWFETIEGILTGDLAGALQAQIDAMRHILTSNRVYYVRTDGNDLNTGLVNDAAGAFLTIQHAIDMACDLDMRSYRVTINVANGSYSGGIVLKSHHGGQKIELIGNVTTPSSVVLSVTQGNVISTIGDDGLYRLPYSGGSYEIRGFKLEQVFGATIGNLLLVANGFRVSINSIDFGWCYRNHILVTDGGSLTVLSPGYTVSGDSYAIGHCKVMNCGLYSMEGGTIVISTNPVAIPKWIEVARCGIVYMSGVSFTNKAYVIGQRYFVEKNGVLDTNGGGDTYLPGNTAGSTETGGQYV